MRRRTGIVLAGGRGERLGLGQPKGWAIVAGRTLLERAVATLRARCDEVLVVAPPELDLPPCDAVRVADTPGIRGPLAGLVAGLAAAHAREALLLGVDFPLVQVGTLDALCAARGRAVAAAAAPHGRLQPLVASFGPAARARLARALDLGGRALVPAFEALGGVIADDTALEHWPGGLEAFLNVNTPEALRMAQARLAAESCV